MIIIRIVEPIASSKEQTGDRENTC